MNENRPENESSRGAGPEPKSGLSVSREDSAGRSTAPRARRRGGKGGDTPWGFAQADDGIITHWFLPLAGLVLVLCITSIVMYFSHGAQLRTLKSDVSLLREQAATSTTPEVDRILARVDELGSQLGAIEGLDAELRALKTQLSERDKRLEAHADRIAALERAPGPASGSEGGETAAAETGNLEQAGGGEWVINLITLGDSAAAKSFQERLNALDIESRIEPITSGNKTLQRVVVPGFKSQEEAQNMVPELKKRLELSDEPWITRQSE